MGARHHGLRQYSVPGGATVAGMAGSMVEEEESLCVES